MSGTVWPPTWQDSHERNRMAAEGVDRLEMAPPTQVATLGSRSMGP